MKKKGSKLLCVLVLLLSICAPLSTTTVKAADWGNAGLNEIFYQRHSVVQEGDRGWIVGSIQRTLNSHGYNAGPADEIFGWQTREALKRWQSDHNIPSDGIYGPQTYSAMRRAYPGEIQ